jgi:hypothetical protein
MPLHAGRRQVSESDLGSLDYVFSCYLVGKQPVGIWIESGVGGCGDEGTHTRRASGVVLVVAQQTACAQANMAPSGSLPVRAPPFFGMSGRTLPVGVAAPLPCSPGYPLHQRPR